MILSIKRLLFRWMPALAVGLTKLASRTKWVELTVVQAVAPSDQVAIDIGASWGLYTFLLCRCTKQVIAFEPNPEKAAYLKSFFERRNVTVHAVALSDRSGRAELIVPLAAPAFATIETTNPLSTASDRTTTRIEVPLRALNDYRLKNVGLVKIDVEGHELAVLLGASELLMQEKPILYVRIERRHNPQSFHRVFDLLFELSYQGYFCDERRLVDVKFFDFDRDQPVQNAKGSRIEGRYIYNFLFLPPSMIEVSLAALSRCGFEVQKLR